MEEAEDFFVVLMEIIETRGASLAFYLSGFLVYA